MSQIAKRSIHVIQNSPIEAVNEIASAIGIITIIFIPAYSWSSLPDLIPNRYEVFALIDIWHTKWTVWMLPLTAIFFQALFTVLCRLDNRRNLPWAITDENKDTYNQNVRLVLSLIKLELVWLCTYLEWRIVQEALGKMEGLATILLPALLLIILGMTIYYLVMAFKVR